MFARFVALLSVAAFTAGALAAPSWGDVCKGGSVKCCNQEFEGATPFKALSGSSLIDAVVGAVVGAGLTCDPIGLAAISSGGQCQSQTACCTGDQNGLVNIQCVPIAANAA